MEAGESSPRATRQATNTNTTPGSSPSDGFHGSTSDADGVRADMTTTPASTATASHGARRRVSIHDRKVNHAPFHQMAVASPAEDR